MLGLLPQGLKSAKNTTDQTTASNLLNALALDLRSVPAGGNTTPIYGIELPSTGAQANTINFFFNEDGTTNSVGTSLSARYGVLLTMSNPTSQITTARIQIYWPPLIPANNLNNAQGIVESLVTINRL